MELKVKDTRKRIQAFTIDFFIEWEGQELDGNLDVRQDETEIYWNCVLPKSFEDFLNYGFTEVDFIERILEAHTKKEAKLNEN